MTKNEASSETRHEIMRKMRRLEKQGFTWEGRWTELNKYIKGMAKRASAKKGGLGRK